MRRLHLLATTLLLLSAAIPAAAQTATVYGHVAAEGSSDGLEKVNVIIFGRAGVGTTTDALGNYRIDVPAGEVVTLIFSFVGYEDVIKRVELEPGRSYRFSPVMAVDRRELDAVTITDERERREFILTIPVEQIQYIPDPSGDPIMAALRQMGASSNNELSTQYSVRGGNFDENLVYVNDFEVYRPLLVRSGQQEGFPFPNYNLTDRIAFSAGGFEASYGDKLSSVLDITYKKPRSYGASVTASLLGGERAHRGGGATRPMPVCWSACATRTTPTCSIHCRRKANTTPRSSMCRD